MRPTHPTAATGMTVAAPALFLRPGGVVHVDGVAPEPDPLPELEPEQPERERVLGVLPAAGIRAGALPTGAGIMPTLELDVDSLDGPVTVTVVLSDAQAKELPRTIGEATRHAREQVRRARREAGALA